MVNAVVSMVGVVILVNTVVQDVNLNLVTVIPLDLVPAPVPDQDLVPVQRVFPSMKSAIIKSIGLLHLMMDHTTMMKLF